MYSIVPVNSYLWFLSSNFSNDHFVFNVSGNAQNAGMIFEYYNASYSHGVSPAFYLSSDITLTGAGTEASPYRIIA